MTTPIQVSLSPLQWRLLLQFMDEQSDAFACAGCNDFPIKMTPENKEALSQLARDAEFDATGGAVDEDWLKTKIDRAEASGTLWFNDSFLLGHIQTQIQTATGLKPMKR